MLTDDGGVAQGTHGTADESDQGCLIAGKVGAIILGLIDLEPLFEVAVSRKVDGLVRTLSQSRQAHTTIQSTHTFFLHNGVQRMRGVPVLWDISWIFFFRSAS